MILISGASRGIGKYLFNTFKNQCKDVIGFYNHTKPTKYSNLYYKLDVSDFNNVETILTPLLENQKKIILINCAGINYNSFIHKSDPEKWGNVIKTNLIGTYNMIRVVIPFMRGNEYGRIINFSSVVAIKPTPGISAYAATKSAFWGLAKSISVENATKNVTINNINLGYSELGMISEVPAQYLDAIKSEIPMKKLCSPKNIFNTVSYLIDNEYITGESINVNGGLT